MKNRIKDHRKIKAKDLVPHEMNPRVHSDEQREALQAIYQEIGFARSLLAYELPDGRLKLIDGHLRASMDPEQEVEVEVLDVNDEEARKLLLTIDPLAQLADYDNQALDALRDLASTDQDSLKTLWQSLQESAKATEQAIFSTSTRKKNKETEEQYVVIVALQSEKEQIALLRKLKREGYSCKATTS